MKVPVKSQNDLILERETERPKSKQTTHAGLQGVGVYVRKVHPRVPHMHVGIISALLCLCSFSALQLNACCSVYTIVTTCQSQPPASCVSSSEPANRRRHTPTCACASVSRVLQVHRKVFRVVRYFRVGAPLKRTHASVISNPRQL